LQRRGQAASDDSYFCSFRAGLAKSFGTSDKAR
jgi:hypothetical protein